MTTTGGNGDVFDALTVKELRCEKFGLKIAPASQSAAPTTAITTITFVEPVTPDYTIQIVQLSGFGFATADEGNSVLKALANAQIRIAQLETALRDKGIIL